MNILKFLALILRFGGEPLSRLNHALRDQGYPDFWYGGTNFNDAYRPSEKPSIIYWPPSTWPIGKLTEVYLYYIPEEPPQNPDLKFVPKGTEPNKPAHEITLKI